MRLAKGFLTLLIASGLATLTAKPSLALTPTEVFSTDGHATLESIQYLPQKATIAIHANAALHFQVDVDANQGPPPTTTFIVHLYNTSLGYHFQLPAKPVAPILSYRMKRVRATDDTPSATDIYVTVAAGYTVRSMLSPDTHTALLALKPSVTAKAAMTKGIIVRHLEYANARDIANILSMMLPQGNGRIGADEGHNNLVIDNTNGDFDTIESAIDALDKPSHQVILEAQVVEVNTDATRDLGMSYSTSLSTTLQEKAPSADTGSLTQPIPLQPIVRTSTALQATLNMLESKGEARILASPRVAALEGEESKIVTGERIPYFVTQITNNQVYQVKEDFLAGVELTITPRVNEDRFVTASIHTNVSTITGTTPQGYPQLSTRESQAVVRVAAGETIVIGGLLQERDIELTSGIPYFSQLPILGSLFSSKHREQVKTELMVFITPHILSDE